jgi:glycosyltransferase involved in cell wall biosynthesis
VVTSGSGTAPARGLRVLRISHSAVVTAWRQRERLLRTGGVDLTLVSAERWDEGGALVTFTPAGDDFAVPVRTFGHHPNLFLFDPRPLWRLLGDGRWDLIDLHEEPFGLAVAEVLVLRALRARRTPYLVSSAQNLPKRYPPPFRWFERWSLRGAAGAYTCNAEAGQHLKDKGLRGAWELLPLGVDTERFRPRRRTAPESRLRVGFVGRLIPVKGVEVLLRAVARDVRLDLEIYGGGPDDAALRSLVAELGVEQRVTFHGHVDEAALVDVFPSFDVLAVPSVLVPNVLEQFGRVVVEAQA